MAIAMLKLTPLPDAITGNFNEVCLLLMETVQQGDPHQIC